MKLSELEIQTEEVRVSDDFSFRVRGLSLSDISNLLRLHGDALEGVYLEHLVDSDEDPAGFNMAAVARAVMQAAPMAVAQAVALAADEPEAAAKVARLPIPVQIAAVESVLNLTFHTEDEVKNVLGAVLRGSGAVQRILMGMNAPSERGSGRSVGVSVS